jgi:hypothetical protein
MRRPKNRLIFFAPLKTMKTFHIKIRAYGYCTEFNVQSLDEAITLENAIVDKLGKNDINWEKTKFYTSLKKWLTFEEVHDGTITKPLQQEKVVGIKLGAGAS